MRHDGVMRRPGWIALLLLVGVVLIGLSFSDRDSTLPPGSEPLSTTPSLSPGTTAAPDVSPGATQRPSQGLPREALETIDLIEAGGPFPYDRDGAVFMNRERLLPQHPRGYWHEYTVPTPGASDRGARRIVAGQDGDLYYTDDHYRSFVRVEAGP